MKEKTKALQAAFPHTIPVLAGFMILGTAYGILMSSKGYGIGWTVLMSLVIFAGSAQFVAITFLTSVFNPLYALLMTLMHAIYSMAFPCWISTKTPINLSPILFLAFVMKHFQLSVQLSLLKGLIKIGFGFSLPFLTTVTGC